MKIGHLLASQLLILVTVCFVGCEPPKPIDAVQGKWEGAGMYLEFFPQGKMIYGTRSAGSQNYDKVHATYKWVGDTKIEFSYGVTTTNLATQQSYDQTAKQVLEMNAQKTEFIVGVNGKERVRRAN